MRKTYAILAILASFFLVSFGQPARLPLLGVASSIFGFALFWWGMRHFRFRFLMGWLWFTGIQLIHLSWMTSHEYQGRYIFIVWGMLCTLAGTQFGLLSLLIPRKEKWTLLRALAIPAAWTILEWARLYFLSGYTWNLVGLLLTGYDAPRQMVTLFGIYGLSFWVMLVNALVLWGIDYRRKFIWAASMAALPYLFGLAHIQIHEQWAQTHPERPLRVLLIQTGLFPSERSGFGIGAKKMINPTHQWTRLMELMQPHRGKEVDLIVMPEGVVPFQARYLAYHVTEAIKCIRKGLGPDAFLPVAERAAVSNAFFCQAIAETFNADLIAGLDDAEGSEVYNAALFFRPGHPQIVDRYAKRILLPLAEYIPGPWAKPLCDIYGITGSFTPGKEARLFNSLCPLGVSVCYEETFPGIVRESGLLGAEVLVNLTNDGWYPESKLPAQHFHHGRLRSLENGVPLVRACCTGVTVAVDSLGRTIDQVGNGDCDCEPIAEALYVEVPRYRYRTLYQLLGDGFPVGLSAIILMVFFRPRRKRR